MMRKTRRIAASKHVFRIDWLARILVVFLVGLLVVGGVGGWVLYSQRKWSGADPYRVLFTDRVNHFYVLEVLVSPVRVGLVKVPADVIIDVIPTSYGSYRLGSLFELGEIESLDDVFVVRSLSSALGMMIDAVAYLDEGEFNQQFSSRLKSLIWRAGMMREINPADAYRLWRTLGEVDAKLVSELDLSEAPVYQERAIGDVLLERRFNNEFLAVYLNRWQPVIEQDTQDIQLMVINTTDAAGKAREVSRMLAREGFQIIGVGDREETLMESALVLRPELADRLDLFTQISDLWGAKLLTSDQSSYDLEDRVDGVFLIGSNML